MFGNRSRLANAGFTLVEVMLALGLMSMLAAIVTINLLKPQVDVSLNSTVSLIVADLKGQQAKAMAGDSVSASSPQSHGLRVQSDDYVLFKGSTYSGSDSDNFTVDLDTGVTLTTTLPSAQVVFLARSGEVAGWTDGSNTITVVAPSNAAKVITINRYGGVTVTSVGNIQWLEGWGYRKAITIDSSVVDADLADFPVLVKLTSANFDFAKARSDGLDVRFTAVDGTTLLSYERERHDESGQVAEYWVRVPSVAGATDTAFYVYYGKADATDGQNAASVWDSNYLGVWHLNQNPTGGAPQMLDSTANNNDGTVNGAMTAGQLVTGQVASALNFDGNNDYIALPSLGTQTQVTTETWFRAETLGANEGLVSRNAFTNGSVQFKVHDAAASLRAQARGQTIATTPIGATTWYYGSYTFVTSGNLTLFLNDTVAATQGAGNTNWNGNGIEIGHEDNSYSAGTRFFDGIIDEVRVSSTVRSNAWLKASYHSGRDTLLSLGAEETL